MTEIRWIETEADREAVCRFRYWIGVEEMGRPQPHADHHRRRLAEPADERGAIFAAFDTSGDVLGTIRHNWASDPGLGPERERCRLDLLGPYRHCRTTLATRLIVRPDQWGTALPEQLCLEALAHVIHRGVCFSLVPARPRDGLGLFLARLGYRSLLPAETDGLTRSPVPMILACHDIEHLRRVRSPLLEHLEGVALDADSVRYFHRDYIPALLRTVPDSPLASPDGGCERRSSPGRAARLVSDGAFSRTRAVHLSRRLR